MPKSVYFTEAGRTFPRRADKLNDDAYAPVIRIVENGSQATEEGHIIDPRYDAFGFLRVSNRRTVFSSKRISNSAVNDITWNTAEVSGGGTSSAYSQAAARTRLSVAATTAGKIVTQTYRRFNYQSGKSQLCTFTYSNLTALPGNMKEVGLFDDSNGIFLRYVGGNDPGQQMQVVIRSSVTGAPVDTVINQEDWNVDPFDGTGNSELTIDSDMSNIFFVDFEWLGVGTVAFGFVIERQRFYCHFEHNGNIHPNVYMSTPNLPIRYSIENDGTGAVDYFDAICCSVESEGGLDPIGLTKGISRGVTGYVTGANTSIHCLAMIRLKTTDLGITVLPTNISLLCTSGVDFSWGLLLRPTFNGLTPAQVQAHGSWADVPSASIQYNVGITNANIITGGIALAGGYIYGETSGNSAGVANVSADIANTLIQLGSAIDGTRDIIALVVQNLTASSETYYAAMNVVEYG